MGGGGGGGGGGRFGGGRGEGLAICPWLGLLWFSYWFPLTLAYSRISHEYSSLSIIVINLICMFSLCVILFLRFSILLALWLPRLGKRELLLVLFVHLFDLCLFGFVCFLFLLVSGKGCDL